MHLNQVQARGYVCGYVCGCVCGYVYVCGCVCGAVLQTHRHTDTQTHRHTDTQPRRHRYSMIFIIIYVHRS